MVFGSRSPPPYSPGSLEPERFPEPEGAANDSVYSRATGRIALIDNTTTGEAFVILNLGPVSVRVKPGGAAEYTHLDHLGSPAAATAANGALMWRESYNPFGEQRISPAANDNKPGFTGHVDDAATGLTYMQARYYDPVLGRFLSTDPIGYQDQLNLYAYVSNDPVNATDPTGMCGAEKDRNCPTEEADAEEPRVIDTIVVTAERAPRASSASVSVAMETPFDEARDQLVADITDTLLPVFSCFRANAEYSAGAQIGLGVKTPYAGLGLRADAASWRMNAKETYQHQGIESHATLGVGPFSIGGEAAVERTTTPSGYIWDQPWNTSSQPNSFVGVGLDVALILGVQGELGFEVPVDGSCSE